MPSPESNLGVGDYAMPDAFISTQREAWPVRSDDSLKDASSQMDESPDDEQSQDPGPDRSEPAQRENIDLKHAYSTNAPVGENVGSVQLAAGGLLPDSAGASEIGGTHEQLSGMSPSQAVSAVSPPGPAHTDPMDVDASLAVKEKPVGEDWMFMMNLDNGHDDPAIQNNGGQNAILTIPEQSGNIQEATTANADAGMAPQYAIPHNSTNSFLSDIDVMDFDNALGQSLEDCLTQQDAEPDLLDFSTLFDNAPSPFPHVPPGPAAPYSTSTDAPTITTHSGIPSSPPLVPYTAPQTSHPPAAATHHSRPPLLPLPGFPNSQASSSGLRLGASLLKTAKEKPSGAPGARMTPEARKMILRYQVRAKQAATGQVPQVAAGVPLPVPLQPRAKGERGVAEMVARGGVASLPLSLPLPVAGPETVEEDAAEEALEREESERAAAEFAKEKKKYERLKRKGEISVWDDIAFMKLQSAEDIRLKKLEQSRLRRIEETDGLSDDQALFCSGKRARAHQESEDESGDDRAPEVDTGEGPSSRKRPRVALPIKLLKPEMFQDAKERSMLVGIQADLDKAKKKKKKNADEGGEEPAAGGKKQARKPKGGPKKSRAKAAQKGKKGAAKNAPKEKEKKSRGRPKERNMISLGDLQNNNVIRDAQTHDGGPGEAGFDARRKGEALKQLIASIPEGTCRKDAYNDKFYLMQATRDFSTKRTVFPDGKEGWRLRGMKSSLSNSQLLGVSFMRKREHAVEEPLGGIIADQMGLGKTVMMLANMVDGRAPKGQPKTTLIIASPALVNQWYEEIFKHVEPKVVGRVNKYVAGHKPSSNTTVEDLQTFDIVLTTYTEVMKSYPKYSPPEECQTAEQKKAWWIEYLEEMKGDLHRIHFHRVVLDEAQAIKNHLAKTSIACRALMANYRWALSGTPIMNSLEELYPYFKFLNVPFTGTYNIFKANYGNRSNPDTQDRLLARLSVFMLRRTHKDLLFGRPILKLPKTQVITHWVRFNDVERNAYDIVKNRFIDIINGFARSKKLEQRYKHIFTMLLRLRQLTGHLITIQTTIEDLLKREDIERLRQVTDKETNISENTDRGKQIIQLREVLAKYVSRTNPQESPQGVTESQDSSAGPSQPAGPSTAPTATSTEGQTTKGQALLEVGGRHGLSYDFTRYLDKLQEGEKWEEIKEKAKCSSCRQIPDNPYLTSCHHIYCLDCLGLETLLAAQQDQDRASCRVCGVEYTFSYPCEDPDAKSPELSEEISDSEEEDAPKRRRWRRKNDEDAKNNWIEMKGRVLPSAKTLAIKAQILNWLAENPKVKIIVYTQFFRIRILERVCQSEGWDYCKYQGKMSLSARDKAIQEFKFDGHKHILLASLKCGGQGLNLMMASRVIVIDPWWNNAVEQQAFCRVFRYGQKEETFMTRFCVENTVDEDLVKMQERKQDEIDGIMENGGATSKK